MQQTSNTIWLAEQQHLATQIKAGIYRHYKGHLYQVIGVAHDANADTIGDELYFDQHNDADLVVFGERLVVVYMPLELNDAHEGPRMAVRSVEDFSAHVCGDPNHASYGRSKPKHFACATERFRYLGAVYTHKMREG